MARGDLAHGKRRPSPWQDKQMFTFQTSGLNQITGIMPLTRALDCVKQNVPFLHSGILLPPVPPCPALCFLSTVHCPFGGHQVWLWEGEGRKAAQTDAPTDP